MGRSKSGDSRSSTTKNTIPLLHRNPVVLLEDVIKNESSANEDESSAKFRGRSSSRTPKNIKTTVTEISMSEDESDTDEVNEIESDASEEEVQIKKKVKGKPIPKKSVIKAPSKTRKAPAPKASPASKKRLLENGSSKAGNKSKKAKKGSDDDYDDYSKSEEEDSAGEDGSVSEASDDDDLKKKKPKKAIKTKKPAKNANKGKETEDDDDEEMNLEIDEDTDDEDWEEPDYQKKGWLKNNCLICQICKKTFKETGDALKCFHSHKDNLRCYVCFYVIKGGKIGTKRLFRHYQKRHAQGDTPQSLKCVHCDEQYPYKSISCHIIAIHFREALGLMLDSGKGYRPGAESGKKSRKAKDFSDIEEDEEENYHDNEKEPEDKIIAEGGQVMDEDDEADDEEEEEQDTEESDDHLDDASDSGSDYSLN